MFYRPGGRVAARSSNLNSDSVFVFRWKRPGPSRYRWDMNAVRPLPSPREMDRAFRSRDAAYDGIFFTAVRSTAIFCRPSCPARKPRPDNVEFFPTARQAIAAGYRACLRCRPLKVNGAPDWADRLVAAVECNPAGPFADRDL